MGPFTSRLGRRVRYVAVSLAILPAAALATPVYQYAFITSTKDVGDLSVWTENDSSGLSDPLDLADHICQVRAEAAGLATDGDPVFRAWISTSTVDAYCHVQGLSGLKADVPACGTESPPPMPGPWVLIDGRQFAGDLDSLVDIGAGGPLMSAVVDETGSLQLGEKFFTGTASDGTLAIPVRTCDDWSVGDSSEFYNGGHSEAVGTYWSAGYSSTCGATLHLLCLSQSPAATPPLPEGPGALVFVTSATGPGKLADWPQADSGVGVEAGDEICANLALDAGFPAPGSFVAFLSDGAIAASSRLAIDGPWRRFDGYVVAQSKGDLLDGHLAAPILYDELGNYRRSREVWTGSTTNGSAAADRCLDWDSADGGQNGVRGDASRAYGYWSTFSGTGSCTGERSLYCFSNVVTSFPLSTIFSDGFEIGDTSRWSSVVSAL